jgi:hypothetical protein
MQKTLTVAVSDEIHNGFVANGCEFSAHDITVAIRKKINAGDLEIHGLPFQDVDGTPNTQRIEHDAVRTEVHGVCGVDNITGYARKWNRTVGYFSWTLDAATDDDDDDFVNIATKDGTSVIWNSQTPAPALPPKTPTIKANAAANPNDHIVIGKILNYVNGRVNDGVNPTLKATQSCIKRNPLTVRQISDIVQNNGYKISNDGGKAYCYSEITPSS